MNLFRTEDKQLAAEIAHNYDHLATLNPASPEYKETAARLTELNALKNQGLDPTKLVVAALNTVVAFKVLKFEETGVIGTKMFSFMQKF